MFRNGIHLGQACALLLATLCGCTQPASVDLASSMKGIEESKFLSCSGPPSLEYSEAGQDRMSFLTNLKRGNAIGIVSPMAMPEASCSVDAVFQNGRLVNATFSGDQAMCGLVFSPCLQK